MTGEREPRWLTIAEAQKRVSRSRDTIDRWIRRGMLNPIRISETSLGKGRPRIAVNEDELLVADRDARRANPARPRRKIHDAVPSAVADVCPEPGQATGETA